MWCTTWWWLALRRLTGRERLTEILLIFLIFLFVCCLYLWSRVYFSELVHRTGEGAADCAARWQFASSSSHSSFFLSLFISPNSSPPSYFPQSEGVEAGSRIYWVDEPSSLTLQGGSRWAILLTVVVKRPVVETETLPPPCHSPLLNPPCNSSLLNLQNLVISYFESPESPKSQTDTLKGLPNSSIPPQYKKSPKQLNAAKKSLLLTQLLMNIRWQHWYSLNLPNIILSLASVISHSKNNSLKKKNVAVTIPSSCIWPYETFLGSPSS